MLRITRNLLHFRMMALMSSLIISLVLVNENGKILLDDFGKETKRQCKQYVREQVFFDYIFAYGSLGLSGIFRNSKHGILKGYLTGVFGRFVFSFLSGIIFFAAASTAAGAEYGLNLPVYSAVYNGAYLGAEAAITVAVIMIPPVNKALKYVKVMALGNRQ